MALFGDRVEKLDLAERPLRPRETGDPVSIGQEERRRQRGVNQAPAVLEMARVPAIPAPRFFEEGGDRLILRPTGEGCSRRDALERDLLEDLVKKNAGSPSPRKLFRRSGFREERRRLIRRVFQCVFGRLVAGAALQARVRLDDEPRVAVPEIAERSGEVALLEKRLG